MFFAAWPPAPDCISCERRNHRSVPGFFNDHFLFNADSVSSYSHLIWTLEPSWWQTQDSRCFRRALWQGQHQIYTRILTRGLLFDKWLDFVFANQGPTRYLKEWPHLIQYIFTLPFPHLPSRNSGMFYIKYLVIEFLRFCFFLTLTSPNILPKGGFAVFFL